ncbi:hypothetical protein FQN49_004003 [Arthroderma sp. PD_2]|nr:hypothetical protein FQN49_004003 [Arthroderma sp. PD_2]
MADKEEILENGTKKDTALSPTDPEPQSSLLLAYPACPSIEDTPRPLSLGIEEQEEKVVEEEEKADEKEGEKEEEKEDKEEEASEKEKDQEKGEIEEERLPPLSPSPPIPQSWTWRCHKCHAYYALAVTNRCLGDGHYYCYGIAQGNRNQERKKKQTEGVKRLGTPCSSSFDYAGWENMNEWQREVRRRRDIKPSPGCWEDCTFPSECRHKRLHSILNPPMSGSSDEVSPEGRDPEPLHVRPQLAPCIEDPAIYQIFSDLVLASEASSSHPDGA